MNLDQQAQGVFNRIHHLGVNTPGRTTTHRKRLLEGVNLHYDCSDGTMDAFTLRENNPKLAIAETLAFIMGAEYVHQLEAAHPALKLWDAWASKTTGSLGGVYGDAFHDQYVNIIQGLKTQPLSTHHRMTTLLPDYFPVPGNTYSENVREGKFALMPCLHSYHFLSDGDNLVLHATQASGDTPIGVFPHNAYQVQFMLLLTAHLTKLKPQTAIHHIHDVHYYDNQVQAVQKMCSTRKSLDQRIKVDFAENLLDSTKFEHIKDWVSTSSFNTHPAIHIKVDS